jgi:preprotein translocase SecY subunit
MFRKIGLVFQDKELRAKILKVIGLLIVARLLTHVPIPGVTTTSGGADLSSLIDGNALFGLLNVISGGGYGVLSFVMLGISPYITSSIVFQLLGIIVPRINEIRKDEGQAGQQKINKWTRWLAVPLSALQSWGVLRYITSQPDLSAKIQFNGPSAWIVAIVAMTAGCIIMMWIGELITEYKLGNGISLLILSGIVVKLPKNIADNWQGISDGAGKFWDKVVTQGNWSYLISKEHWNNFWNNGEYGNFRSFFVLMLSFVITLLLVVFMNDSVRKLLVIYTRRGHSVGSSRTLDSVKADLPIKVNISGVIPIIFAVSFILFPTVIATILTTANVEGIKDSALKVENYLSASRAVYPGSQVPVQEPVDLKGKGFLGIYKVSSQAELLSAKQYDTTQGGDVLGFTLNNFARDCNPAPDNAELGIYKNTLDSRILGIDLGCQSQRPLAFFPEFGIQWHGVSTYNFLYFLLIIFFTYFYTANIAFKTDEVAENLQKSGAYVPGQKPGKQTEQYLSYIANRLNVVGSLFLALVAMFPIVISQYITFSQQTGLASVVGGTTILILVSVAIDTLRQIDAQIISADYDRFLKK